MLPEIQCWHRNIGDDGICRDCGVRAAITLEDKPDHVPLEERLGNEVAALRKAIADLLHHVGVRAVCKGPKCQQDIFLVDHKATSGKRTPYNPDGTNHFATCVDREMFRRKRG